MAESSEGELFAAVDLGSNSFHMIIARRIGGELQVIDRMREQVQLAAGFDPAKNLTQISQERALACLRRFGERLRPIPPAHVRAVGTNTLRRARNARRFLEQARKALGHPVEVISGREEARVLYLGVALGLTEREGRRLVVDIGGGSTECIIGESNEPISAESMHMGCVHYTQRFFGEGKLRLEAFRAATVAACQELEPIERRFRSLGWAYALGASGTIAAIDGILRQNGWSNGITRDGLRWLRKEMLAAKTIPRLHMAGLNSERAVVLPGGFAILYGVFKSLKIETMSVSTGALREGLLFELIGQLEHEDVRDRTATRIMERYHVDIEQARRVEHTVMHCLDQVSGAWGLLDPDHRRYLRWAALLHEVGLAISYSGYHKHGAYLVANSDLAGFSRNGQRLLAAMVLSHRRRLRPEVFDDITGMPRETALRLAVLLRLAVTLNRRRDPEGVGALRVIADGSDLEIDFTPGWLDSHPMSLADLRQERAFLGAAGFALRVGPVSPRPRAARPHARG